jgi:hypothetical protein
MSALVTIGDVTTPVVSYRDQRVCTTIQLSQFYGADEVRIQQNHSRNLDRFEEGKHFYKVAGDELRDLRLALSESQISSKARSLILWTERGAARHAKMLETEKAWEVFEQMEDRYFAGRAEPESTITGRGITRDQVDASVLLLRSAVEDLKLAPSAVLGAYQRIEAQLGVVGFLPAYAVDASTASATGSSDETKAAGALLEQFGADISTQAFNRMLMQHGFLEERERPSSKGGTKKFKVITDLEYGKNLTSPTNPRESQPHWYVSKFGELLNLVLPEKPKLVKA